MAKNKNLACAGVDVVANVRYSGLTNFDSKPQDRRGGSTGGRGSDPKNDNFCLPHVLGGSSRALMSQNRNFDGF